MNTDTAPAQEQPERTGPRPLIPTEIGWGKRYQHKIVWDLTPRSPFADAIRYLKIPYRVQTGGNLEVVTTCSDMLLVSAYCQRFDKSKAFEIPKARQQLLFGGNE